MCGLELLGWCTEFKGKHSQGDRTVLQNVFVYLELGAVIWVDAVFLRIASTEKIECAWRFLKEAETCPSAPRIGLISTVFVPFIVRSTEITFLVTFGSLIVTGYVSCMNSISQVVLNVLRPI